MSILFGVINLDGVDGGRHLSADRDVSSALSRLQSKARNGDEFCSWDVKNDWAFVDFGVFFGSTRRKALYSPNDFYIHGDVKKWTWAALDIIGDQSSVRELIDVTIRQGFAFKKYTKETFVSFELFEHYVQNKVNYGMVVQQRTLWKKHHGRTTDCRTYRGQPDRNMIRNRI